MNFAILRHNKLKSHGAIAKVFNHNARLKVENNIDPTRSHLNRIMDANGKITPVKQGWLNGRVRTRLRESGINRVKEGTVLAIEILMTTSPEWWEEQGPEGSDGRKQAGVKWLRENMKYLVERFGAENVLSVALHQDEQTPHLHAVVMPIMMKIDGRSKTKIPKPTLCAKDMLGGRGKEGLTEIVQSYGKRFESLGLRPGIPSEIGEKLKRHVPIKEHQDRLYQIRRSSELLLDEQKAYHASQQEIGGAVSTAIQLVADGHVTQSDGNLLASDHGFAAIKNVHPLVGPETMEKLVRLVLSKVDQAVCEAEKIANDKMAKAANAEATADKLIIDTANKNALAKAELAKAEIQKLANEETQKNLENLTLEIMRDRKDIADRSAALEQKIRDAEKAEAAASEAQKLAERKAHEALNLQRAQIEIERQTIEAGKSALEQKKREIEKAEIKANEARKLHEEKLLEELSRQTAQVEIDRQKAAESRKLTASYLAGIDAFHEGKIRMAVIADGGKRLKLDAQLSDDERSSLIAMISPAWDRVWEYVKTHTERLRQLADREILTQALIEAATKARNTFERHAEKTIAALANLPEIQKTTPEVQTAKKVISEAQADDDFALLLSQYNSMGGLGR